ncbi:MAG: hypothetical protein OEZ59_11200, partial [Deltaproteobacteria bacterium]|nr:hypothetical protein [Deltaproteobacteria bacterium]
RNPLAYKQISTIFQPLLSKTEEVLQQFQASFGMEREKARLRQVYLEFTKEMDSRAPVEVIEVKGQKTRRINYNIHRLENLAYSQSGKIMKRMEDNWKKYIQNKLLQNKDSNLAFKHLLEILNTLVKSSQFSMEGRIKVAQTIRKFADDQERLGKAQLGLRKRKFEEAKRKKSRELAKFRSQEQDKMVETIKRELVQLDEQSRADLQRMEESVNQRRDAQIAKVDHLEQAAREDREKNLGKSAGVLFRIAGEVDTERIIRGELVTHLVKQIQDDRDESYNILYKNLWDIFPDLFPTEKIVLRATIDKKIKLEDDELRISEQEMGSYQQQIANRKSELEGILPGVFDQKVSQGPVSIRLDNLLEMKLTSQSLRLLMQLPFNAPNKPPAKLPPQVVKHVLMINQLTHPMPENDIVLPNVGEDQPAAKRINFNRLQKISP